MEYSDAMDAFYLSCRRLLDIFITLFSSLLIVESRWTHQAIRLSRRPACGRYPSGPEETDMRGAVESSVARHYPPAPPGHRGGGFADRAAARHGG